jgi:hypothetical protein
MFTENQSSVGSDGRSIWRPLTLNPLPKKELNFKREMRVWP